MAEIGSLKEMGISSVTFSSDEIAVGTKKGFVKIYENNKQMKLVETLKIYEGPVSAIQFLSDKHLLTCGARTNRRKSTLNKHYVNYFFTFCSRLHSVLKFVLHIMPQ